MKKLIVFFLVIGVVGGVCYVAYRYYLPKKIAEAMTSGDEIAIVPPKVQKKVEAVKEAVDERITELPKLMKKSAIEYEDLLKIIDEVDPQEISSAFEELKKRNWKTVEDAFEIAKKHVAIEGYDIEQFRSLFTEHLTTDAIEDLITAAEENELLTSLSFPVLKETAKRIIESKKAEIMEQFD